VLIIVLLYFVCVVGLANLPHTCSKDPLIMPANHHDPGVHNEAWNPRIVIPAGSLCESPESVTPACLWRGSSDLKTPGFPLEDCGLTMNRFARSPLCALDADFPPA
jgi:hypothetical protein